MPEPWRVAVIGPVVFPDANRRVYARLKMLRDDWPKASFHIITSATGQVASAALRAAKKLGMSYTSFAGNPIVISERVIAWWDFDCEETRQHIKTALVEEIHTEVYDRDNEPAGPAAAEAVL